jgi:hypothetical protein
MGRAADRLNLSKYYYTELQRGELEARWSKAIELQQSNLGPDNLLLIWSPQLS